MVKLMGIPPVLVDRIPEGAAHHRTAALFWICQWILQYRDHPIKKGHPDLLAMDIHEAFIIRMNENRNASREQLRAGSGDRQLFTVFKLESQCDQLALAFQIIYISLGNACLAGRTPD